jgi:hypothetical protein
MRLSDFPPNLSLWASPLSTSAPWQFLSHPGPTVRPSRERLLVLQGGQTYEYLQLVEWFPEAGHDRQRLRATLGHRDQLVATGALDGLPTSLARFSERLRVVERVRTGGLQAHQAKT